MENLADDCLETRFRDRLLTVVMLKDIIEVVVPVVARTDSILPRRSPRQP